MIKESGPRQTRTKNVRYDLIIGRQIRWIRSGFILRMGGCPGNENTARQWWADRWWADLRRRVR